MIDPISSMTPQPPTLPHSKQDLIHLAKNLENGLRTFEDSLKALKKDPSLLHNNSYVSDVSMCIQNLDLASKKALKV